MRTDLVSEATLSWLCRPVMATGLNLGLARVPGAVRSMEARARNLFPVLSDGPLELLPMLSVSDLLPGHQKS